jgi:hypothetical protein
MQQTRISYEGCMYEDGKKRGGPLLFDTFQQAEEFIGVPTNEKWPRTEVIRIPWDVEFVAEGFSGFVVKEVRTLHVPGGPISGMRPTAELRASALTPEGVLPESRPLLRQRRGGGSTASPSSPRVIQGSPPRALPIRAVGG